MGNTNTHCVAQSSSQTNSINLSFSYYSKENLQWKKKLLLSERFNFNKCIYWGLKYAEQDEPLQVCY